MTQSVLNAKETNTERKKREKTIDTIRPSEWSLQIALIVAVTLLVSACIISLITKANRRQYNPITPYEFPYHQLQKGIMPHWSE